MIILDRDGVINYDSDDYIKSQEEWQPLPGSIEAIVKLQQKSIPIAIATNQSGIGRGYTTSKKVQEMHDKMNGLLVAAGGHPLTHIYYCPHIPKDNCSCRKPKPGMLEQILDDFGKTKAEAVFIGDSLSDLHAAHHLGIRCVLVRTGKGVKTEKLLEATTMPHFIYDDLEKFVDYYINN